jgi:hypothetical protein
MVPEGYATLNGSYEPSQTMCGLEGHVRRMGVREGEGAYTGGRADGVRHGGVEIGSNNEVWYYVLALCSARIVRNYAHA